LRGFLFVQSTAIHCHYKNARKDTTYPRNVANFNGILENEVIPSMANLIIFL